MATAKKIQAINWNNQSKKKTALKEENEFKQPK